MSQHRIDVSAVAFAEPEGSSGGGSAADEDGTTASLNAISTIPDRTASRQLEPTRTRASIIPPRCCCRTARCGLAEAILCAAPMKNIWRSKAGVPVHAGPEQYVVAATRPVITSAPSSIAWGGSFTVSTPDAASISSVVLIRNGAPTHSFDMDTRLVGLSFSTGSGSLPLPAA